MPHMSATAFDTHAIIKRLLEAGMPEAQAEALVAALRQLGDTKADIKALEERLNQFATKADLRELENRLIKWMVGIAFASVALNLTVIALFVG
jgi:hypothetical protein